jgi:hypothetical protein
VDVVGRHLHRQTNAIFREFLDLSLHPAIQADPSGPGRVGSANCACFC